MVSYPGNKARYDLGDLGTFSEVYDFFMGTGGFTIAADQPGAIVYGAEANPCQRWLLQIVNSGDQVYQAELLSLASNTAKELKALLEPTWDGKGTYSALYPDSHKVIKALWIERVKKPWDLVMMQGQPAGLEAVAAQVLIGTYGYAGNIRSSGNGLNSPFNAQKLKTARPVLPKPVPGYLREVYNHYSGLEPSEGSLCLIDPMYWLPRCYKTSHQKCTSCYSALIGGHLVRHDPYNPDGLIDYTATVEKAMVAQAKTVLVTGYFSVTLNRELVRLGLVHGYLGTYKELKPLATQGHRHRLIHSDRSVRQDLPKPIEGLWTFTLVD